jgi:hypothetical protein
MDAQRIGRSGEHLTDSVRDREKRNPPMTVAHLLKRQNEWLGGLKQRLVRAHVVARLRISQRHINPHRPDALDEHFDAQTLFIVLGQNRLSAIVNINHFFEADLDRCHRRKIR